MTTTGGTTTAPEQCSAAETALAILALDVALAGLTDVTRPELERLSRDCTYSARHAYWLTVTAH